MLNNITLCLLKMFLATDAMSFLLAGSEQSMMLADEPVLHGLTLNFRFHHFITPQLRI